MQNLFVKDLYITTSLTYAKELPLVSHAFMSLYNHTGVALFMYNTTLFVACKI